MSVTLLWFRRDFRLHDNAALHAALDSAGSVVPVYIHAPEEERVDGSDWSPGAASRWWLHHSLEALEQALRRRGSRLVIRRSASSLEALQQLLDETGATAVHWNRLYEPHLVARDRHIKTALREAGITATSHAGCLLHEPMQVQTKQGRPYQVFTPFWKSLQPLLETTLDQEAPLPVPDNLQAPAEFPLQLSLRDLELLPQIDWAQGIAVNWQPGEDGAHQRLRRFFDDAVSTYAEGRDYPTRDDVSRLSPHLHFGELTPRQAWQATKNEMQVSPGSRRGAAAFLRELGWREFAHHVLFHFPNTPDEPLYEKYAAFPWRRNYGELLRAWQEGMTGYPIVDAGMRQLWQTGWMHNRVRMVVASLLVKNLRIPWQEGARWFWDTLVDADLANNTMGWQWAAGCGADAAPYFRIFNPMTQAEKFDTVGYIRKYVPELAALPDRYVYQPWKTPADVQESTGFVPGKNYPQPVVDYRESREEALAALQALKNAN
jgi:deoxyribodipyrimidine photo-lyase